MNRTEYLLVCLAEECNEVAQRVTKALRFGMEDVQPGQDRSNGQRIVDELADLFATLEVVSVTDKILPMAMSGAEWDQAIDAKKAKIEKYYQYAVKIGAVGNMQEAPPEVEDVMEAMLIMRKMISPDGNLMMDGANLQRLNKILYPQSTHNLDTDVAKPESSS